MSYSLTLSDPAGLQFTVAAYSPNVEAAKAAALEAYPECAVVGVKEYRDDFDPADMDSFDDIPF